jgi:betaine lipid synthase
MPPPSPGFPLFFLSSCRFGGGIPFKQYQLILKDGVHMSAYAARTFDGVAQASHLRGDNYFYYNCMTGG